MDEKIEIDALILDVDYVNIGDKSTIRIAAKGKGSGTAFFYDKSFSPYVYLIPSNRRLDAETMKRLDLRSKDTRIEISGVEEKEIKHAGMGVRVFKISTTNTRYVPMLRDSLGEFGECYEHDILFWKRYIIDKGISPMHGARITAHKEGDVFVVDKIEKADVKEDLTHLCFDIETYNPIGAPRQEKDPVIMISYSCNGNRKVLTTKKIDREFVICFESEKEMINAFSEVIRSMDVDIIAGYNSSNFDIPYLVKRAEVTGADFAIGRGREQVKTEHHGLVEAVKIPGRINVDVYNVAKFVSVVGASEKLIRANRLTLSEVYGAITGDVKKMVDRRNIWQLWDGSKDDLENLADYSLADSLALDELYKFFINLEIEVSKVSGTTLGEACVSTTGQLVEFLLMRYAYDNKEIVPNKPSDSEIRMREANPIEGAYVKTPDAGVYRNIGVFDFRGLYPSIIITYNIDPSTICNDESAEFYQSPAGTRFLKEPAGIIPSALRRLTGERLGIKKAAKKDPDNKELAARSQALKIIANSFYGYLGYARSRWYSRDCAASVTALGRAHIMQTIDAAEKAGFRVLYSDTDSIFLLLEGKSKEDALGFLKKFNSSLPESMELELEDFYVSGVFVGKRGGDSGAKKKYALLSESGRIKIRGFELVRRDWSGVARETQRKVLEAILKNGSKDEAIKIVKDVVSMLRENKVPIGDLVIRTQLRKRIDSYDGKSPELAAAKKAIEKGIRSKDDLEGSTINYVVTRSGSSVSEKAVLEEMADNYDPDYYIEHQIIPATLKILKELGVSEEELKGRGSQRRL